jgi:hypothetical protein
MRLVLPASAADVTAIKPHNHGFGRPRRRRLRRRRHSRLYNGLSDPHSSIPHRSRVRRPADRQQLRQEVRDLAKWRQRCLSRRHIGQFGRHGRGLEVERGEALCFVSILAGTGEQAPNPNWNVTKQQAECRGVMSLAGADARKPHRCSDAHRRSSLVPVRQACLLIAFNARHLRPPSSLRPATPSPA